MGVVDDVGELVALRDFAITAGQTDKDEAAKQEGRFCHEDGGCESYVDGRWMAMFDD
ncbi:MAG: hypothetical protein AAFV46_11920 [Cyanobacteria bacterium J06635_11]